jgi:hypothetical protein
VEAVQSTPHRTFLQEEVTAMTLTKTKVALLCCALALGLLAAPQSHSAEDKATDAAGCRGHLSSVISAAGLSTSHAGFFTAGTFGQPTPIGTAHGSGITLSAGFMPPYTFDYFCDLKNPVSTPGMTVDTSPNPFASSVRIRYSLELEAPVSISVYDVAGRKVRSLITARRLPGTHCCQWDGRDADGLAVSSGVYWCVLKAGPSRITRKMLLVR